MIWIRIYNYKINNTWFQHSFKILKGTSVNLTWISKFIKYANQSHSICKQFLDRSQVNSGGLSTLETCFWAATHRWRWDGGSSDDAWDSSRLLRSGCRLWRLMASRWLSSLQSLLLASMFGSFRKRRRFLVSECVFGLLLSNSLRWNRGLALRLQRSKKEGETHGSCG